MKYLVTGGAGFIGSNIVLELVRKGHEVGVIDNLSFGKIENLELVKDKIKFVEGDIRDLDLLEKEFKGVDFVLHQAALRSVPESFKKSEEYFDVNVNGTKNVLEAALRNNVKKVVFASSAAVYGDSEELPQKEDTMASPKSPYAQSKLDGERLCKEYSENGLKILMLRYFNVFGPMQDPSSEYSNVIPKFIKLVLEGIQPTIFGDGKQSRDFIYVKDVVKANLKACEEGISGEVINIARGKGISVNGLLSNINSILGGEIRAKFEGSREGDVKHMLADISKQKKLLKIEPDYSFEEGLKETIDWFKKGV